jgi:hypothetical protein
MERALYYRAADRSWWEERPHGGLLYMLEPGERWELLDDGSVMVVHHDRSPAMSRQLGSLRSSDRIAS